MQYLIDILLCFNIINRLVTSCQVVYEGLGMIHGDQADRGSDSGRASFRVGGLKDREWSLDSWSEVRLM